MALEIEAKLKVDAHAPTEQALAANHAQFIAELFQTDYHFDDPDGTFARTDRCLRLRCQRAAEKQSFFLTYKGPKQVSTLKQRQEIELEITDPDTARQLLAALGFQQVLVVEKKRKLWRLHNCLVALDHLPELGCFIEIEGPDDQSITAVQQALGLAHLSHIPESYACLLVRKASEQNQTQSHNRVQAND